MSLAGTQLGNYQLLRSIGSGGMGEVYLAEDTRIQRQVAIKVIREEATPYPGAPVSTEAARLFQREMKAIAQLDHPSILPLFDFGEASVNRTKLTYMVMPFRQEGSLADWLQEYSTAEMLSPQDVAHVVSQAADALQHAHDHQIIHQDVKPSNFLIRSRSTDPNHPDLLLADFGIAKFTSATTTASQNIRGTPTSMAPEQWDGQPVAATDQYALAIMAYQLLTGRPPFLGGPGQVMRQHYVTPPEPPSRLNAQLSPVLDAVLLRALAKQPNERFASVAAFAHAFQQAVQSNDTRMPIVHSHTPDVLEPTSLAPSESSVAPTVLSANVTPPTEVTPQAHYMLPPMKMPHLSTTPIIQPHSIAPAKRNTSWRIALVVLVILAIVGGIIWLNLPHGPVVGNIPEPTSAITGPTKTIAPTRSIVPSGSISEFPIPTPESIPQGITAGPDGNLWFTEADGNKIGRITLNGTISEFPISTSASPPFAITSGGITAGPDGNLWFTEAQGNQIGRITPNGTISEFPIPTSGSYPFAIAAGPDGNLWFTEGGGNKIGRITPNGTISEFPIPTSGSNPSGITAGPDGNLWFTEFIGDKIGRITPNGTISEFPPPTFGSQPTGITAGPDGNLWFTETNGNKIGRITPNGTISEFLIPTSGSTLTGITAGSDGNLWFTEFDGNKIGRITTGK